MKSLRRSELLLLDVAAQFEHGTPAMHHEWLRDNNITFDELAGLTDKLGAIVRGYVQSPQHVQLAILAASAMPDKQTGRVASALLDQRRAQRNLSFDRAGRPRHPPAAPSAHVVSDSLGNWTQEQPAEPGFYWTRFNPESPAVEARLVTIQRGTACLQLQCADGSWANLSNFDNCWWSGPLLPPALPHT